MFLKFGEVAKFKDLVQPVVIFKIRGVSAAAPLTGKAAALC